MRAQDKIRDRFKTHNILVDSRKKQINVWYGFDRNRGEWVPAAGGPIYGQAAIDHAEWLAGQIDKYRDLLPKSVRDYRVRVVTS